MNYINESLFSTTKMRKNKTNNVILIPSWSDTTYYNKNSINKFGLMRNNGHSKNDDSVDYNGDNNKMDAFDDTWKHIVETSRNGCQANIRYYLQRSTLHGMKYIGDIHLHVVERIFWFVSVFAAVLFAAYFIGILYVKWISSPMIVSVSPDSLSITSIPFPAITVCNNNLAKKSVAERINREGQTIDQKLLEVLCNINNGSTTLDIDQSRAGEWNYFKHFLINVTQPCTQLLASCQWKSYPIQCDKLFNAALTDEGICCTFNSLPRDMMFRNPKYLTDLNITFPSTSVDWTPEAGYPSNTPSDGFPWRPLGSGTSMGLTLVLDADIDEYYCSSTSSAGFKILLHSPAETPKIADYADLIPPGFELRIPVKPKVNDFQSSLRNIALSQRKCLFADEKNLLYYKIYTQRNCALECETRLTIEKCNCSQYHMPKNSSVRICGMADFNCYTGVKVAIEDMFDWNETDALHKTNCDECFPGCYELGYSHDISMAVLSDSYDIREEMLGGKTLEYFKRNMAIIHVYFVDKTFIRNTKGEIYGFTDFLSNTGGILGLFMGFSFLSFVEILYFLSLRIVCSFRRNAVKKKKDKIFPFSP